MNDDLEARLRAHFRQQAAATPVPGAPAGALGLARPNRRPLLLAAAAVVVLAAIATALVFGGSDDDDLQVVDDPSTTTTTTTEATTTSTSQGPRDTTSTSTTSPVTTPATGRTVIVVPSGVLGVWTGTAWQRIGAEGTELLTGGEEYLLVGLEGPPRRATGGQPREGCILGDDPPPIVDIPALAIDAPGGPVAVHGVADPQPRPVTPIDPATATYVEAASTTLAGLGIDDPAPPLVQLVRVDLEGDGVDEVLFVAERHAPEGGALGAVGDYSVVALRRVVDGVVETHVFHRSLTSEPMGDGPFGFIEVGRINAVADLNGDGRLEMVLEASNDEGTGSFATEIQPSGPVQILEVGCGA